MKLVGFIDEDPLVNLPARVAPVLGGYDDIAACVEQLHIDHIVIAFSSIPGDALIDVIREADRLDCEISNVPRLFEISATPPGNDEIGGIPPYPTTSFRLPLTSLAAQAARRSECVGSRPCFVVPDSRHNCAAEQAHRRARGYLPSGTSWPRRRADRDPWKFRSLRPASDKEAATTWNVKNDDRMSSFGRFLRRSSLDELPQLWNIFRGDMSLVGPRPERPHFVEEFAVRYTRYEHRHRVPTGGTGWAQVNGLRGDTSIGERARFDNYYIENWSLWLDFKIILLTFVRLFRGSG